MNCCLRWTHSLQKALPRLIRLDRNNNSLVENEKYSQSPSDVQVFFRFTRDLILLLPSKTASQFYEKLHRVLKEVYICVNSKRTKKLFSSELS